jgi:NADPH:quinone reductase
MATMKAVQMTRTGGVEVLEYVDIPIPKPGPDQVLVRNAYSGVNFKDTYRLTPFDVIDFARYIRTGLYPAPKLPYIFGGEGSGIVEEIGDGVSHVKKGDRVAYYEDGVCSHFLAFID